MTYSLTYPNPSSIPRAVTPTKPVSTEPVLDELGMLAFNEIATAIKKQTEDKILLGRLAQIASVFDHRTKIAVKIAHLPDWWARRADEERLLTFKKPEFFINAARAVLIDVLAANRALEAVAAEKREQRLQKQQASKLRRERNARNYW